MTKVPKPASWWEIYNLTYDAWNRLVKVKAGMSTVAEYAYDGHNRRISKTIDSTARHYYYSPGWQVLEERVGSSSYADRQFVWGVRYIDDLVLRDRDADQDSETGDLGKTDSGLEERLYALQDANWNVVALADGSGTVQERDLYFPFGKPIVLGPTFGGRGTSSYDWEHLYTGRRYDAETGLYHYRNRPYHAELGRFVSRDPIGYRDSMNQYQYAAGTPINVIDAFGATWVRTRVGRLPAGMPLFVKWAYNTLCLENCSMGRQYCGNSDILWTKCEELYQACVDYCKMIQDSMRQYEEPGPPYHRCVPPAGAIATGAVIFGVSRHAGSAIGQVVGLGTSLIGLAWEAVELWIIARSGISKAQRTSIRKAYRQHGWTLDPLTEGKSASGAAYGTRSTGVFLDFSEATYGGALPGWTGFWITPCERESITQRPVSIFVRNAQGLWRKLVVEDAGEVGESTCLYADEVFRIQMYMAQVSSWSRIRGVSKDLWDIPTVAEVPK